MFIDAEEIAELRKKVQLLTEENKRLKYRLNSLLDDCTGSTLHTLRNIIMNYCEDLKGDTPIVINQDGEYKLGVSLTECSVKELKDWSDYEYQYSALKGFGDNTKVLLLS